MKPILLLDVDGVLLMQHYQKGLTGYSKFGYPAYLNPKHPAWLKELGEVYDIVWCTGWGHMANKKISPLMGLGQLPVIELNPVKNFSESAQIHHMESLGIDNLLTMLDHRSNWKLSSVEKWLEAYPDVPIAWLDDMVGTFDVEDWAEERARKVPTALVETKGWEGLTNHQFHVLKAHAGNGRAFLDKTE